MITYHGKMYVLDEVDLSPYSTENLRKVLKDLNEQAIDETGRWIDLCIVDHINLFKFGDVNFGVIDTINKYSDFFRQQSLNWCDTGKPVAMIVLAQANRECQKYWEKGKRADDKNKNVKEIHEGDYLLSHFAEGNELERASSSVLTIYMNDSLKALKEVRIGLIKNRDGETVNGFFKKVELEYYTIGDRLFNIEEEKIKNIPGYKDVLDNQIKDGNEFDFAV